jgi:hypothetical protein
MNGNDHLRQTLEYYKQQLQKKIEEIAPLQLMIRQLERELGESSSTTDISEAASGAAFQAVQNFSSERGTDVRPDEFFGMSHNEAAKAYLSKVGRAISLDELVAALKKGGAQVGGATPKKSLYVSLMRSPIREFVSPSENHIGLRSFYPGLPKGDKSPKAGKAKKGKPKKKLRPMKKADKVETAAEAPAKEVPIALESIMKDGKARKPEAILTALEATLGHPVKKISVTGTLQGKRYQKLETGEYQLVSVQ